ncbi:hypothetical protein [Psychrobacillus sp. OK032]|uniref:hypothetical protein n=1 Tax=Psychrobacillus sp. OK032 TaxID=1884358 RepID=UPI0008C5EEB3|nr:hypothetical protein [Psychrobacillus sp. OK032]SES44437.1 hypothetical protein SAMN05518872_11414 [Psychrobacillus sp. OK032]
MKLKFLYLTITVFSIGIIIGCTNKQVIEENTNDTDNYGDVRAVAWEFINEKGWNDRAKEDWQSAKVKKTIADNSYELLDKTYDGKEVLTVSFEDKNSVVIGTPSILVDPDSNEVIGYMPSE